MEASAENRRLHNQLEGLDAGSRQLYEQLESLKDHCSCWSLDADRQLLAALQDMSSGLLDSLQRCRAELTSVAGDAEAAAVTVAAVTSQFRLLSHRRFIQQVVSLVLEF